MKYDKKYLQKVLKRHGYNPVQPDGDWLSFAVQLLMLEKISERK